MNILFSWQPEKHVPLTAVRLPPKESTAKPDYRENEKVEVRNLFCFVILEKMGGGVEMILSMGIDVSACFEEA